MSNRQIKSQIIAYHASFLSPECRKHSRIYKKGTCPNGQVPLLSMSELTYSSTAACAAARRYLSVTIDVRINNFKVISYIYLPIFKHEKQLFFVNATFFKIGTKYNPFKH